MPTRHKRQSQSTHLNLNLLLMLVDALVNHVELRLSRETICILTACQGLLRAISQAFLCFVKSSRKNALTKCNLRPNTGGGEVAPHITAPRCSDCICQLSILSVELRVDCPSSPVCPFFLPLSVSRGDPLDTLSSSPDCAAFLSGKCNFESVLNMPKSQTNAV